MGEEEKLVISVANDEGVQREFKVNVEIYGVNCARVLKIDPYKTISFPLSIKPVLGGIYAGCITFTDQFRKHMWYTFEMDYQGKKNVRNIEFVGLLRKENRLEIEVENPSDERIEFKVFIKGEGLSGDDNITVGPKETGRFALFFLPLRIMDSDATVIFSNSKIGELLCKVELKSKEPTPVKLGLVKCEVGKSEEKLIELENPSGKSVAVTLQSFTSDVFTVLEREFEIEAYKTRQVRLVYTPNEIEAQDSCELTFMTAAMGNWKFVAFGKGLYPTAYPVKEFATELQRESSSTIIFRNPFKQSIGVLIKLEVNDASDEETFNLIQKRSKVVMPAGTTIQIPFSFFPTEIRDYSATIVVYLNDKIAWRYPVKVITESKTKSVEFALGTVCRKKVEKEFILSLPGLGKERVTEPFKMELVQVGKGDLEVIKRWLTVLEKESFIDPDSRLLTFTMRFNPQKPIKTFGEVLITRASGGKWK